MKILLIFSLLLIATASIATAKDMPLPKVGDPCWNTSGASKKAIISTGGIVLICKSNKFSLATPQELVELNENSQPKIMPHPEVFDVYHIARKVPSLRAGMDSANTEVASTNFALTR